MIRFEVDTRDLDKLTKWAALATGKFDKIMAIAMSQSAKAAKEQLATRVLPQIQGGATAWTRQGLRYWRADRSRQQPARISGIGTARMVAGVGWNYGDNTPEDLGYTPKGMGVPSGRYMELQATGGSRKPKSTELALRRAGLIRSGQFVSPFSQKAQRAGGLTVNKQGNVPGPEYRQILSRLKVETPGSTQSASGAGSRGRTAAKKRSTDYFMLSRNGMAEYIARRAGAKPKGGTGKGTHNPGRPQTVGYQRGFVRALHIMDSAPQYRPRFDIHQIAWATFSATFGPEFRQALEAEVFKQAGIR